jgi:hypothetical protein
MPPLIRTCLLAALSSLCLATPIAFGQTHPTPQQPENLTSTIAAMDKRLFDAYNTCDLTTLASLVQDDLEFYHDKTGLSVGKPVFIEAIRNNICGKVHRTLDEGTMEVYPLANYGAVEIGMHHFSHPSHPEDGFGEAKFITIWHLQNGAWKVSRVISYDHQPAAPPAK